MNTMTTTTTTTTTIKLARCIKTWDTWYRQATAKGYSPNEASEIAHRVEAIIVKQRAGYKPSAADAKFYNKLKTALFTA